MSHYTIIYGRINGSTWRTDDYYKLHRFNKQIIESLPLDELLINRSMFNIPNEQGIFRNQIITFGASYKTLEYEWNEWIEKFESLLRKLYWWDVVIHADFEVMGEYTYKWKVDTEQIKENWFQDNPLPINTWKFETDGYMKYDL